MTTRDLVFLLLGMILGWRLSVAITMYLELHHLPLFGRILFAIMSFFGLKLGVNVQ
jgi:uncharacterized protein YacL